MKSVTVVGQTGASHVDAPMYGAWTAALRAASRAAAETVSIVNTSRQPSNRPTTSAMNTGSVMASSTSAWPRPDRDHRRCLIGATSLDDRHGVGLDRPTAARDEREDESEVMGDRDADLVAA